MKTREANNEPGTATASAVSSSSQAATVAATVDHHNAAVGCDEEFQQQQIRELRKLVEECTQMNLRTDDAFLMRYLRCCRWDAQVAFERMQSYYRIKAANPKWCASGNVDRYKRLIKKNAKVMLDKRDKKGRRIYLTKMKNIDPSSTTAQEMAQLDDVWFEAVLDEPETQENGIAVVIDMTGYSWRMLSWLTPKNTKIATQKVECAPLRKIEYHIVNSSQLMNAAVSLVFPFLSQAMKEHIYFHHSNWPALHAHLGQESLPEEYGGNRNLNFDKLNALLLDNQNTISDSLQCGFI